LLKLSSDATQRSSGTEDLRGFEWYYWDRLRQSALDTWQLEMYNHEAVCSGNGERLLTLGNDDILRLWNTSNKKKLVEIELRNYGYFSRAVAISFDGGVFATVCSEQLTGEEMKKLSAREIESRSRTKTVIVWNGSGRELFKLEGFADRTEIDISGNGKILAVYEVEKISEVWEVGMISTVYAQGKSVKLFDASTGEKLRDLPLEIKNSNDFFLSPDGREVFVIDSSHGDGTFSARHLTRSLFGARI